jgi:hypothetical protein
MRERSCAQSWKGRCHRLGLSAHTSPASPRMAAGLRGCSASSNPLPARIENPHSLDPLIALSIAASRESKDLRAAIDAETTFGHHQPSLVKDQGTLDL